MNWKELAELEREELKALDETETVKALLEAQEETARNMRNMERALRSSPHLLHVLREAKELAGEILEMLNFVS